MTAGAFLDAYTEWIPWLCVAFMCGLWLFTLAWASNWEFRATVAEAQLRHAAYLAQPPAPSEKDMGVWTFTGNGQLEYVVTWVDLGPYGEMNEA